MAREEALAIAAASSKIFSIRSSGSNGSPFLMPIAANCHTSSGLNASAGSYCITAFNSS
ncbi:MAG: hypothetical protein ACERKJ_05425 [Candidatus Dadabacteria bacterium]